MKRLASSLFLVALFASVAPAQLASTAQPAQAQAQTAPCVTVPSNAHKQQGGTVALKPPTKWQQYLDAQRKAFAIKYGVVLPDTPTQVPLAPQPALPPCPPPVAVAAPPAPKLPTDTTVTLHCNPTTPSSKDAGHPTTLTLPDPHDFAIPKPSDFEADTVVPDLAAKTPCYLVKVDPATQKPFIQR